jgi:ubiquinone/menaquinone biosynthesis C-methylase UbiE
MEEITRRHYQKVARLYGHSPNSTMKDPVIREAECEFVIGEIKRFLIYENANPTIMDLGCGNGTLISHLFKLFPQCHFVGVEYSEEMFELAKTREEFQDNPQVNILHGDCSDKNFNPGKAHIIITERVLINILSWEKRQQAFSNIVRLLHPEGRYIMMESFRVNLENLNRARRENRLAAIKSSNHNQYLTEKEITKFKNQGVLEVPGFFEKNHLSTHFYIGRVLHHLVRPKGGKVENTEFVNFFNLALPPGVGEYSPILFRVFEKSFFELVC